MTRAVLGWVLLCAGTLTAQPAPRKPFDIWALNRLARISDPQLSPDGSTVAFVVERVFVSDNSKQKHIYTVPLEGGAPRRISLWGQLNTRPRWSPDSRQVAFVSDRSGSSQIWIMAADGGNPRQMTDLATEADGVLFSPDGKRLVFTSRVFPECGADNQCNAEKLEDRRRSGVEARVYDGLLYRRWDTWDDKRRSHLLTLSLDEEGKPAELRDLTPGPYDVPPFSLGGPDAYDIAPDGFEVCYTTGPRQDPATSTNTDLYVVPIEGGQATLITTNPAADASPRYSPDGRYIAYRSQERPGYESDRFRLTLYTRATGEVAYLTETLDRWVTGMAWSPDSSRLFFTAEDRGRQPIFAVPVGGGGIRMVVFGDAYHGDVQVAPDGRSIVYSGDSGSHPTEIFRGFSSGGPPVRLTHLNDELLQQYNLTELEEVTYESAAGVRISGFVAKPPGFSYEKKYPLLLLVHGGPQGAWGESWSYRWNAQVFAGADFIVFMPNPRGSTGYGQSLIDAINHDWGGKAYEDIMAGVDYMTQRPYVDSGKLVAAGASYGGYMINWILGHTGRFRALISHAGVFDLRSMFGSTEELWFPLWEFGATPWDDPEMYERWSPSNFVESFKTPTLVVHGEKDYRVPAAQGMQLFTALQLKKVPSKFLYFPDEGHWIRKPRNALLWYQTVLEWLQQWVGRKYIPVTEPAPPPESQNQTGPVDPGASKIEIDSGAKQP